MNYLTKMYVWLMSLFAPLKNRKGQGLVEYALIIVLLVAIVLMAMQLLKGGTNNAFSKVVNTLNTAQP